MAKAKPKAGKSPMIGIVLPPELLAAVRKRMKRDKVTMSAAARAALAHWAGVVGDADFKPGRPAKESSTR